MEYYVEKAGKPEEKLFHCHRQVFNGKVTIVDAHIHDWIEILYCVSGDMCVLLGGIEQHFTKGSLVIIPSNEIHRIVGLTDGIHEYIVIKFAPELVSSVIDPTDYEIILPFILKDSESPLFFTAETVAKSDVVSIAYNILSEFHEKQFGYQLAVKADIYRLITFIMRRWRETKAISFPGKGSEHVRRIFDMLVYIQKNFRSSITLETMADMCHVSYSYFSRQFSLVTGKTFANYLCSVRLC